MKILVVEDSLMDADILVDSLKKTKIENLKVDLVQSVPEAINALESNTYDFIFSDFYLGLETAEELIASPIFMSSRTPLAIMSGTSNIAKIAQLLVINRIEMISKEFVHHDYLEFILKKTILNQRHESYLNNMISRVEKFHNQLKEVSYSSAHDLKSPLQTLEGVADLLLIGLNEDEVQEVATMLKTLSKSMNSLILELMKYATMDLGLKSDQNLVEIDVSNKGVESVAVEGSEPAAKKIKSASGKYAEGQHLDENRNFLCADQISMKDVMNEVKVNLNYLIKEKSAKITLSGEDDVFSDRRIIKTIILNLVSNSLKYSRDGVPPEICVSAKKEGGFYVLTITDNGVGVEESELEDMFVPLKRLSNVGSISGHGLGGAIVANSVRHLSGILKVQSEVGKGTTVQLTFPDQKSAKMAS